MGDTGSLALGGLMAALAIVTSTELLLVVLGGLFVVETAVGDRAGDRVPRVRARGSSAWRRSTTTSSSPAGRSSR